MINHSKNPYIKLCKYKHCRKEFEAKRLNQEYCCQDHKIKANNIKGKEKRDATNRIYNILLKNREILKSFYNKSKVKVTLQELENAGFIFGYHTQMKKIKDQNISIPMCFEYGLIKDEDQPNIFEIWKE